MIALPSFIPSKVLEYRGLNIASGGENVYGWCIP
jgi:hypothetical protein